MAPFDKPQCLVEWKCQQVSVSECVLVAALSYVIQLELSSD